MHISGSGSIHSTLSEFSNARTVTNRALLADISFSPSVDEGLNNCSLSDNSPVSFTRRQPPKQNEEQIDAAEYARHAARECGGGDGTLTNSNRRERTSRNVENSKKPASADAAKNADLFALSRC